MQLTSSDKRQILERAGYSFDSVGRWWSANWRLGAEGGEEGAWRHFVGRGDVYQDTTGEVYRLVTCAYYVTAGHHVVVYEYLWPGSLRVECRPKDEFEDRSRFARLE